MTGPDQQRRILGRLRESGEVRRQTPSEQLESALKCQRQTISAQDWGMTGTREQRLQRRVLYYDPAFEWPESGTFINLDGRRWNPLPGTWQDVTHNDGTVLVKRVDVVRAS